MRVLRTTKCPNCETEITGKHTKGQWTNTPSDFYGGKVKKMKDAVCECGTELIVFYAPDGNNYKIVDMAYKNEPAKAIESAKDQIQELEQEPVKSKSEIRKELIAKAKALGIEGKIATMGTEVLEAKIKEAEDGKEKE